MLCFPSSYGDWTSPHPLQQEKAAPVPLIPFPSQVDWKTGKCPKKAPVSVKKNAALAKTLGKEGYELQVRPGGAQRPFLCPFGSEHAALRLKDRIPHRQLQFLVRL